MKGEKTYTSRHAIGDAVNMSHVFGSGQSKGVVVGVRFTESKVLYDIDLDIGGVTMRDIDSTFVSPDLVEMAAV